MLRTIRSTPPVSAGGCLRWRRGWRGRCGNADRQGSPTKHYRPDTHIGCFHHHRRLQLRRCRRRSSGCTSGAATSCHRGGAATRDHRSNCSQRVAASRNCPTCRGQRRNRRPTGVSSCRSIASTGEKGSGQLGNRPGLSSGPQRPRTAWTNRRGNVPRKSRKNAIATATLAATASRKRKPGRTHVP